MKNQKKYYLICTILHAITALLFIVGGIANVVSNKSNGWVDITPFGLGITFGSISYMYFEKYRKEK